MGEHTEQGGLGTTQDPAAQDAQTQENEQHIEQALREFESEQPQQKQQRTNQPAANDAEARYWASMGQPDPRYTQDQALANDTTAQTASEEPRLCNVYWFHTDQAGMPEELTNADGQLVWQATYKTWGATVAEEWEVKTLAGQKPIEEGDKPNTEQNLRFQGQYLDRSTGLHYNTFRYYDADIGRFICPDPIGLSGGLNLHSYAPNPISWIDPWGWTPKAPLSLPDGYRGRIDRFNTGQGSSFEVHVYAPNGKEVGVYGPDGFFNKHGTVGSDVRVPAKVSDALNGIGVDELRKTDQLPAKGTPNSRQSAREHTDRIRRSGKSGC